MSDTNPKLYVKTGCPWCAEAIEFLDKHRITYQKVTVSNNPAAMDEMVTLSGQTKAPTLDWHGEILADFGAAELEPFLRRLKALT
ncbi:MAG: glutaredoxin family protein [Candidatus Methylacidiphilales bacterium]|nr:glutaredoxin family protein [Candidatus Methylacidiphilales bacterium]